jgi:DNA-binding IclR family transcriptional regulator
MQNSIERLRAEFLEMPGLRLTLTQIHRFCGLERSLCSAALDTLVKEGFLCANADGTYARLTEGEVARARPAKARLDTPELRRQAS